MRQMTMAQWRRFWYARKQRRHPRGSGWIPEHWSMVQAYLRLRPHRRHPQPFNKTERGRQRREERRFKMEQRHEES